MNYVFIILLLNAFGKESTELLAVAEVWAACHLAALQHANQVFQIVASDLEVDNCRSVFFTKFNLGTC